MSTIRVKELANSKEIIPLIIFGSSSSQNPPRILQNSWTDSKNLRESSKILKISPNFLKYPHNTGFTDGLRGKLPQESHFGNQSICARTPN